MWFQALLVAVGGAAGAVARFLVTKISASYPGAAFPYHTLFVNVVGSFILGAVVGLALGRFAVSEPVRLLVGVGFCGAFTTFSTFAVETLANRSVGAVLLNVSLNNVLSIGAAALGLYLAMRI